MSLHEGYNPIDNVGATRVITEGGNVYLPRNGVIGPGTQAIVLDDGVLLDDFHLTEQMVAWGVDVMAQGRQYGNRVYIRNHSGRVLRDSLIGHYREPDAKTAGKTKAA